MHSLMFLLLSVPRNGLMFAVLSLLKMCICYSLDMVNRHYTKREYIVRDSWRIYTCVVCVCVCMW